MSLRKIGAFAGGAAKGISSGVDIMGDAQKQQLLEGKDKRDQGYYEGIMKIMEDVANKRGRFAPEGTAEGGQGGAPAKLAPVSTSVVASSSPDAAGPPESFGGGSADQLTRRSLEGTAQPASPMATSMAQPAPAAPGIPMTPPPMAKRRLPFADFIGS